MSAVSQPPSIYSRREFGKLTLAALPFGIGANTVVFTLLDAAILRQGNRGSDGTRGQAG